MLDQLSASIKRNHFAQMAVCCALPVVVITGFQLVGINGWWIYPLALFVCVGSHAAMTWTGLKEGKSCH